MDQRPCRAPAVHTPALLALLLALSAGCTADHLTEASSPTASDLSDLKGGRKKPPSTPVTLVDLVVSPGTVVLAPEQVQLFTATGLMSDSSTKPIAVTWSATGGTIDASGLYTAGTGGEGRVIATATSGEKADTAQVTVEASTAGPSASCVGTPLYPTDDWATKVAAAASGTTFCVQPGTHRRARNVVPKSGMKFIGVGYRTAILDGADTALYAFQTLSATPSNVVIKYLVIQHYNPPIQHAAIQAGDNGARWTVDSNEVAYSGYAGVRVGRHWHLGWNYIHHNRYLGVGGYKADSVVIEGNRLAYNPPAFMSESGATAEASQMKIFKAVGAVVKNNVVEDGVKKGIWFDTDNHLAVIQGNTVRRQGQAGIWYEASYAAVIANNTVSTCGTADNSGWLSNSGIQVTNSQPVQIYGNVVSGCENGITGMAVNATSGAYYTGRFGLKALGMDVHDNRVTQPTGKIGVGSYPAGSAADTVFTSGRIRWHHNTYDLTGNSLPFTWRNGGRTRLQWQQYGFDTDGIFTP